MKAGTLEIELISNVARLQGEMRDAQRAIDNMTSAGGQSLGRLGNSFKAANDNAAGYARQIMALKAQLDPAWAAQQKYNDAVRLGMDAMKSGAINREQFIAHMRQISAEAKRTGTDVVQSSGMQKAGLQQLGFQMSDVAVQYAGGTRAALIFAQQGPQVVQAIQMMSGGASKFATFMGGPWGVALMIGVSVLGALLSKLTETEKKSKDTARATETLADKLDLAKHSFDEVRKATAEYNEEQARSRHLTLDSAAAVAVLAAKNIQAAISTRQRLQADLDEARQSSAGTYRYNPATGKTEIVQENARAQEVLGKIKQNDAALRELTAGANNAVVNVATEMAKLATDPKYAIEERFKRLRNEAVSSIHDVGGLSARLADLNRQQRAAEKAEADAATSRNRQYGREITMANALAIARSAGLKVNSGTRPTWIRDEKPGGGSSQERLYNLWVAQGRPKDNPTAAPGTSAHERSNALDIQFAPGVTPESIRKAYADEGVRLTKILKERGHFHIEWSTSGADKVEREANHLADFGDKTAESIARINAQFDEAPRLVDQTSAATRQLDDIIAELGKRKPPGFEQMITEAQKAKAVVEDALVRPFRELEQSAKRRSEIELLVAQGRQTEADVVQTIYQLEDKLGTLTAERKKQVREIVENEAKARDHTRAMLIDQQTAAAIRENQLNREMGNRRLGIMSSDMNYAQQAEALRQLNVEQEKRLIQLRAENEIKALGQPSDANAEQSAAILRKAQAEADAVDAQAGIDAVADSMTRLRDISKDIDFASVFGAGGDAIQGMLTALDRLSEAQVAYQVIQQNGSPADRQKAESDYTKAKLAGTAQILGASKKFFKEESAGYKLITTAEKVLAAIQLANTIKSMVMDTTKTATSIANAGVRTAADTAAGGAKMFSFLGPFAFPVVAAMIAVMASLGFKGSGSSSAPAIPSAEDLQAAAGTGSVLGDSKAKSNSIANSLEIVAANTNKDLEFSNSMLKSLRSIDSGISKMAGTVARQIQVAGGMFDTSGANLGSSGSAGFLGLFGSSTTRELWDVGIDLASATVGNIIANGITGNTYQIVQQIKKSSGFLGIGGGTKTTYQTTTGVIDPGITSAIQDVMESLKQGLLSAADVVGFEGAEAIIDSFQVSLGRISFKDMTGEEIESQLNAIFSKVGDDLAAAIMPQLLPLQQIGEGAFETFMRIAREYQVVDTSLKSIGKTFGAVGVASIEARDRLVQLFGSLDDFVTATDYYRENFLTDAEQIAPLKDAIAAQLGSLGLSSISTIDRFKNVVNSLDLTTTAGQDTYAALMALAPAFYKVEQYQAQQATAAADLAKKRADMEVALLKAQGDAAGALAKQREAELAAMDASLRPLQQQIYLATDIAAAKDNLSAAYKRESGELQSAIDKFQGFADTLKDFRDTLTSGVGSVDTYRTAMIKLMEVAGSAAAGDGDAMGRLPGVANTFLDAAKGNASSLQQYRRDVALVARYTDQAIGGANGQVSIAQRQLDQMAAQVGLLVDIDSGVQSVAEAISALQSLITQLSSATLVAPVQDADNRATDREADRADRQALRDEMRAQRELLERIVVNGNQQNRLHRAWDRGGSLGVATDADSPLVTEPAA